MLYHVFYKELITFIIYFISLFARVIPEPVFHEIHFLIVLPIIWSPLSTSRLLFISLGSVFFNYFAYEFAV